MDKLQLYFFKEHVKESSKPRGGLGGGYMLNRLRRAKELEKAKDISSHITAPSDYRKLGLIKMTSQELKQARKELRGKLRKGK